LSRVLRIIKNPRRWTEIGWRMLFRAFYWKNILGMVRRAYENAGSPEAACLRHYAAVAWGLSEGNVAMTRGYMYVAYQSQATLASETYDLGTASIGFEDLKIQVRTTDTNSSRDYLAGFDESLTLFEAYLRAIPPGTAAVDVGANIGIHSLVLSRCVGERGRVYSYEPSRRLCERFRENMTLNHVRNVTLREVGAGPSDCALRFQPREGEFNIGLGKFDSSGPIETEIVKLDSDLHETGRISLIKIDVEGMELDVIRGATAILARHRPTLVIEYNPNWTLDELRGQMPYPVKVSSIPVTMLDRSRNLDRTARLSDFADILVEPAS
jgi:FkbM family methyltransferase